jgi:hypothetical protein
MDKNKTTKYFKYAIGEIVLVVIGILIALQINNWNENQKLDAKTQDYYVQLLDDLNSDIMFSNNTIEKFSNYLKEYEAYTNTYNKDLLKPNQVYENISKLHLTSTPLTFNSSTIESLQNSGDVGLIPSNIRNRLIDLRRQQNLTINRADWVADGKNDILQKLTPLLGSTTLPKRLENQPKISEFLNIDKNIRELILVYEGVHRWKSLSEQESIDRLEDMLTEIDTIVSLINKELKK